MRLLSKNKLKLLKLFYAHPASQFYIQEIGRLLKKKPGVFQRALNNLYKDGLLLSEYKANARFFRINTNNPIYNELKSIVSKTACILVILVLSCAGALYAQDNPLSLRDTILTAFKSNIDIQIQEQELVISRSDILGAKSEFLPQLDLNAGYARNGAVASAVAHGKKEAGVFTGYKNDNSLGAGLSQVVYSGGFNAANLNQARLSLKIAEETLRAKKLDIEFEAKRLYYGLLLAYETERIAQELTGNAKDHYEDVKNRYTQGLSSRFDLLQSSVQVSLTIPELVKAKNAVELIKAELKKLLSFKQQQPLEVTDKQLSYTLIDIKEGDFLKQAYLNKPEMALRTLGVDINKWSIQMAKSGWRPQINANAGYDFRSNNWGNMINKPHSNWNVGFKLSLAVFDGFSTKAKVDAAKARYSQAVLTKENLVEQIAVDVRQACLDLKQAEQVINSQKDNVGQAKEALEIAKVSYDNGEAKNLDVLDAQISLGQIETNLSQGIYDYLMAHAELDRTLGKSFIAVESGTQITQGGINEEKS
ncbi:MAG: TolC family protein [Candidatus Omnitrophica bacterium]|nr:TolC family protein [Candidatus Omnitrophota bacterium]MBU1922929.1 TolC family protein [Candidatus Omnitrophota bacterium]